MALSLILGLILGTAGTTLASPIMSIGEAIQSKPSSYDNGAPSSACITMGAPGFAQLQDLATSPFKIDISDFLACSNMSEPCYYYTPGKAYNISLITVCEKYHGFLIQARRVENETTAVGEFCQPKIGKLHNCIPPNTGVTYDFISDPEGETNGYNSLTFRWTAPPAGTGAITFRYTVAVKISNREVKFWTYDRTMVINEGGCNVPDDDNNEMNW